MNSEEYFEIFKTVGYFEINQKIKTIDNVNLLRNSNPLTVRQLHLKSIKKAEPFLTLPTGMTNNCKKEIFIGAIRFKYMHELASKD